MLITLADKCSGLAQAALELRKVYSVTGEVDAAEPDAVEKLYTNVANVELCIEQLPLAIDWLAIARHRIWEEEMIQVQQEPVRTRRRSS